MLGVFWRASIHDSRYSLASGCRVVETFVWNFCINKHTKETCVDRAFSCRLCGPLYALCLQVISKNHTLDKGKESKETLTCC